MFERGQQVNPEEIFAKLEEMQRQAQETLDKFEALEQEMGATETVATSENGMVSITLNGEGAITNIDIQDAGLRLRNNLTQLILDTIKEAQATHAMKMAEMAQQLAPNLDVMGIVGRHMSSDLRDKARNNLDNS